MSVFATSWAYRQQLESGPKFVLVALADFADGDFVCFPGQKRLATMTGMGERTVRRHLLRLEEMGAIERVERRRADGTRTSDLYRLSAPDDAQLQPARLAGSGGSINRPDSTHQPANLAGHEPSVEPSVEPKTVVGKADVAQDPIFEIPQRERSDDLPEVVRETWNAGCGKLAKARVTSSEARRWIARHAKLHGRAQFLELLAAGLATVREDPHWLGARADKVKRAGDPYGLINYLRHLEDKANLAFERSETQGPPLADVTTGSHWYTTLGCAIRVVSKNGVAGEGVITRVYPSHDDGRLKLGQRITFQREHLKNPRNIDDTERTPF